MTEQEKREKVIKGLECCSGDYALCTTCYLENSGTCRDTLMKDAIELLKAQEPRVMTFDEAFQSGEPMWFEKSGDECGWITGLDCGTLETDTIGQIEGEDWYRLPNADYGRLWRCWTSRPTDAQREAVKWE